LTKPLRLSVLRAHLGLVEPGSAAMAAGSGIETPIDGAAGMRVLLVEDNPVNLEVGVGILEGFGCNVETATNGVEALALHDQREFGIIFMDCQMPEMDGFKATAEIRQRETNTGRRTPIVALTASAIEGDREQCLAAGMDDYLAKPVQIGSLAHKLARWLGSPGPMPKEATVAANDEENVPIDGTMLEDISGGDDRLARDILERFLRHNAEDARMLLAGASAADTDQVTLYSHRIKGAARTIGANQLASVCERLERAARAQDIVSIRSDIAAFNEQVARLDAYIRRRASA
jgi:CheY-like chemotaxis protein